MLSLTSTVVFGLLLGGTVAGPSSCSKADGSCNGGAMLQAGAETTDHNKPGLQARCATMSADVESYTNRATILENHVDKTMTKLAQLTTNKPYAQYAALLHSKLGTKDLQTKIELLEDQFSKLKKRLEDLENKVFGEEYDTQPTLMEIGQQPSVGEDLQQRANALEEVDHSCHLRIIKLESEVTRDGGLLVQKKHGADHPTLPNNEAALGTCFSIQAVFRSLETKDRILAEKLGVATDLQLVETKDTPIQMATLIKTKVSDADLTAIVVQLEADCTLLKDTNKKLQNALLGYNTHTGLIETVTPAPISLANRINKLNECSQKRQDEVDNIWTSTYR